MLPQNGPSGRTYRVFRNLCCSALQTGRTLPRNVAIRPLRPWPPTLESLDGR